MIVLFKIQRPLSSSDPLDKAPMLAYNEDRSLQFMLHQTDELRALVGTALKVYAWLDLDIKDGHISGMRCIGRAPDELAW